MPQETRIPSQPLVWFLCHSGPVGIVGEARCCGTCVAADVYLQCTLFTQTGHLAHVCHPCLALLFQHPPLLIGRSECVSFIMVQMGPSVGRSVPVIPPIPYLGQLD